MVARRCPTTATGQNLDALWEDVQRRLRAWSRTRPSSSGWSRCGRSGTRARRSTSPRPEGIRTWVERRYASLIREALGGAGDAAERGQLRAGRATARSAADERPAIELNPNYTFDRFVIGDGNRFAHAAALAVAEAPSEAYNPLFLHGPPGLGKTHLLVAIANYLRANAPGLSVRYTTAECFTNEFVDALRVERRRGLQEPLPRPRRAARRRRPVPRGQAAHRRGVLPHLQRALRGRQPARALRRPPAERALDPRAERLRDRFEWGLTVPVEPPEPRHPAHRPAAPRPRGRARDGEGDDALSELAAPHRRQRPPAPRRADPGHRPRLADRASRSAPS